VRALANAVEARDLGTSCHVQRVSEFAVAVGSRLGLNPIELSQLEQAAMLHDVGKIGIPDKILLNPGALNEGEWELMRSHPELGLGIVNPVRLPKSVKSGILCHQEAYDGSGYPKGLKGENIPLFARIIAVVDAYDAMVADRPYRRALPQQEAVAELDRCAGSKFDPEVVMAFLEILFNEPLK
jgi:HD-GYP domain-containing protein (c-di-GMP phosphodiesterase class II)